MDTYIAEKGTKFEQIPDIVNMGMRNADGNICHIIGVCKDIRSRIGKKPGDRVLVTVSKQE